MTTSQLQPLTDYLQPGLALVFVGINPSIYSSQRGHYFARPTNRFWPAFSRSRLSLPVRKALDLDALLPEHDAALLDFGIGFTDVVKQPGANASLVTQAQFAEGAMLLRERLEAHKPQVAAFHGLTAYRPFAKYALGVPKAGTALGDQPERLGDTHLFVVPNPSPANAHFRVADQTTWYDRLAEFLDHLSKP
jgi:TDG/mug DNA glycosylase family protein